ncbi:hypothetical protein DL93DRAFT_2084981 [Clavulina sp. PMI_390]|nr:hypothetical protein DL93DRAFT_2084981 [Clavulina sp. PMI_390]
MVSSGACIARLADAAWTRSCDSLRRAAPGVGNVGTARAWCEGGLDSYASLPTEGEAYPVPGDPAFRPPSYRSNSAAPSSPTTPMDYKNRASMPSSDAPDHAQEDRDHLQPGLSMDAGSSGASEPSVASVEQTSTDIPEAPVEVFEASEMSDSDRRRLSSSPRSFRADTLESNATARPLSPMHRKPSPSPMPYPAPQRYNSQTPSPSTPRRRLPVTPNGMPDYFSSVSPQPLPMPSYDYAGSSRLRPPTPTLAYTKNQSQSKIGRGLRRLSLPSFGGTGNR